jgi:hypothetical protein
MTVLDMAEIPSEGRVPFSWLDKFIADCLDCGQRNQAAKIGILHTCPHCRSSNVKPIKKTRVPYRTLTQARDEGRLLVYPDNPTETNAMALADWRSHPRTVKAHTSSQIKPKGVNHETHSQVRSAERPAVSPQ